MVLLFNILIDSCDIIIGHVFPYSHHISQNFSSYLVIQIDTCIIGELVGPPYIIYMVNRRVFDARLVFHFMMFSDTIRAKIFSENYNSVFD